MENRIRQLRSKKGLSQRQLAELVGTSQQQIQRIESGSQSARYDIAVKICAAVGADMEKVFPATVAPLKRARSRSSNSAQSFLQSKLSEELLEAGIDTDTRQWMMKYLLRNGASGVFHIVGDEYRRLHTLVQGGSYRDPFVVFDTDTQRVAINLDHLVFTQFIYEAGDAIIDITEPQEALVAHVSISSEPLVFDIEGDYLDMNEEPEDDRGIELQNMFYMLETSHEKNDVVSFTDVDGERAYIRASDLAMISVPLWAVDPKSRGDEGDDLPPVYSS